MATGGEQKVGYNRLVKDRTITLEEANTTPAYRSIVICQGKIIVADKNDNKIKIYRLRDGKLLDMLDSESEPRDICLTDATTICVLHRDGLIEILSIKSEDMSPVFTREKSFRLDVVFDECHWVVRVNDHIVVIGGKHYTIYWCIVSLDDGHVDTVHQICKTKSGCNYVAAKDNIIHIWCDEVVRRFDIMNPRQCKHGSGAFSPISVAINDDGHIFVCDPNSTASYQRVNIFPPESPRRIYAMFWDNGQLYVTRLYSPEITVLRHVYQERSHTYSEFPMFLITIPDITVETSEEIEQGNIDKGQSSEEVGTNPSIQIPTEGGDNKQENLTEDRIRHLLSSESDLKAYISDDPPEACIKTLLSHATKLDRKESMKLILPFIVQQFTERFCEKHIRVWAGKEVIGPENVQIVLVCFYSESLEKSMQSFYGLKVIYREYNTINTESAEARAYEWKIKSDLSLSHCDLINKVIAMHGENLFKKHSNLEAISSSGILSSKSRGLVQEPCVILYCRVKGIIPFGETQFSQRLQVKEGECIAVDVREGYFSVCADSRNNDQENTFHHERQQQMQPLRMGCRIRPYRGTNEGTMGPFVAINSDKTGFLTCAHVVYSVPEQTTLANTGQVIQNEIEELPAGDVSELDYHNNHQVCGRVLNAMIRGDWSLPSEENLRLCGRVFNAMFRRDLSLPSEKRFGIDAAVIEITSRFPTAGEFVPIEPTQLVDAGFSRDQPPMFGTGRYYEDPITGNYQRNVIKIGSSSGLTRGRLRLTNGMVRYSTLRITDPPVISMQNLMEISPESPNTNPFSTDGDSGAGVFAVDETNSLNCIGLLLGAIRGDTISLAIPIDKILTALIHDNLRIKLKTFP